MNPDFRDMLSAFCEQEVRFLLVGAYALAAHGLPRATGDLDIWLLASAENAERVWQALKSFGAPLKDLDKADFVQTGNVIQIGFVPNRIDLLTSIEAVDFETAWEQRMQMDLEGMTIPVIGRSHLIKNKTALARPQDLADVFRLENLAREEPDPI